MLAFRGGLARNVTATILGEIAPELEALGRRELRGLVTGELIPDPAPVNAARPNGYDWTQITDDGWWPQFAGGTGPDPNSS